MTCAWQRVDGAIDELWLLFWRRVTTGMFYAIMHAIGARLAVAMPRDLRIAPKEGDLLQELLV